MSIGARAALNEHLRHVAKYGIDGEKSITRKSDKNSHDQEGFLAADNANNILDEHWENLLDVSSCRVNSSCEAESFVGAAPLSLLASTFGDSFPMNSVTYATSPEGDGDGIEVMYDVSHDFFNSSRVKLLTTPERSQNRRLDMVVTRDDKPVDVLPFGDDSFIYEEPSSFEEKISGVRTSTSGMFPSTFPNLHNFGISDDSEQILTDGAYHNTTVHSLDPGNISEVPRSGTISFPSPEHHLDLDVSAIIPTADNCGAVHLQSQDFSFMSGQIERKTPCRESGELQNSFPSAPPIAVARRSLQRNSHSIDSSDKQQKENVSPDICSSTNQCKSTGSSLQSAVSSFIEEAKSMASYVVKEVEQSFGGLETLPTDFLRAMDTFTGGTRNDPPSPISQVESNNSSSQESTKKKRVHDKAVHPMNETLLTGRKSSRTAVPRRIYPSSANNQPEEEQGSFLAVRSNPEIQRRSPDVSLHDSFNLGATRYTF
jgi:hypothetical protein